MWPNPPKRWSNGLGNWPRRTHICADSPKFRLNHTNGGRTERGGRAAPKSGRTAPQFDRSGPSLAEPNQVWWTPAEIRPGRTQTWSNRICLPNPEDQHRASSGASRHDLNVCSQTSPRFANIGPNLANNGHQSQMWSNLWPFSAEFDQPRAKSGQGWATIDQLRSDSANVRPKPGPIGPC